MNKNLEEILEERNTKDLDKTFIIEKNDVMMEERKFSGWLSTYGNVDRDGDIIKEGAFAQAISKRDTYPLLFNHMAYGLENVIGEFKAVDKPKGVWIEATLYENEKADLVYQMLKSGALQDMSIGFGIEDMKKDVTWVEDPKRGRWGGGLDITKAYIREGSVVFTPANPKATVNSVKMVQPDQDGDKKPAVKKEASREERMEKMNEIFATFLK